MNIELVLRGRRHGAVVRREEDGSTTVHLNGRAVTVRLRPLAGTECWHVEVDGRVTPIRLRPVAAGVLATVGTTQVAVEVRRTLPVPSRRQASAAGAGVVEVRTPMPGLVVAVPVSPGTAVHEGMAVAVVEAMKMQMEVPSPAAGRVKDVRVQPGQEVTGGQVLMVLAPREDTAAPEARS